MKRGDLLSEPHMLRKAIGATFILLLTTGAVCAQMSPSLHFKNDVAQ
jgi:hypothetical protein